MNAVRERILNSLTTYNDIHEYNDLIAFCVCSECFEEDDCADFDEVVAVVEKDWLLNYMEYLGVEDPFDYLRNEYTSDDSIDWFNEAIRRNTLVMINFN